MDLITSTNRFSLYCEKTGCSPGSLIINSTLATFQMAQTLSVPIINVLYCNQKGSLGSGIRSHLTGRVPAAPPPLRRAHLLSRGPSGEWPWTGADLAASPRSDVIRLSRREKGWKSIRSPSRLRLVFGALSRGWGEQIELSEGFWLLCAMVQMCVCVLDVQAPVYVCVSSHIKHDSPTDMEVAFGGACTEESSHAWGDRTQPGSPLGPGGPCAVVRL